MKQLIVIADMEGASGIFEHNRDALLHEELFPDKLLWREYGRNCITSDVLAVCFAANDFGIDEILLYDMHFASCTESNIIVEKLPANVNFFDTPSRCFLWSRIRGQAIINPFRIITVGQHARNGDDNAYFSHTIQTPPLERFIINNLSVAEIGMAVMCFNGTPYVANIDCAASHREAIELSPNVSCISVKDKLNKWEPSPKETYPLIYNGVLEALKAIDNKTAYEHIGICSCSLSLSKGYKFSAPDSFPWKGGFTEREVFLQAPDIEIALMPA